ncbi:hypothetical protein B0J13DRAFT_524415 [Dactylonectria estremocensis]|uniref:Uncharacterized protein n=1 Tax=Dactylonectria estremocensis TaxID=1079267 RepID=A0A9P9J6S6_9HYPO|nr:hypothetical protein B0J13DRAFT_524415 [Dactylonectria estremocensis]
MPSITAAKDKYALLSFFDTISIVNVTGSISRSWSKAHDALGGVADICATHNSDGVNFLPCGATQLSECLRCILVSYIDNLTRAFDSLLTVKPINIIIIIDDRPEDDLESTIVECSRKLDDLRAPLHQVGIHLFQVGDDHETAKMLRELYEKLNGSMKIRDMFGATAWDRSWPWRKKSLTSKCILDVVLGAVVRRLDHMKNGRLCTRLEQPCTSSVQPFVSANSPFFGPEPV